MLVKALLSFWLGDLAARALLTPAVNPNWERHRFSFWGHHDYWSTIFFKFIIMASNRFVRFIAQAWVSKGVAWSVKPPVAFLLVWTVGRSEGDQGIPNRTDSRLGVEPPR